jgi:acetylornithine deacetylase/succinyl-diaminopimelate desuccinylase-like protein
MAHRPDAAIIVDTFTVVSGGIASADPLVGTGDPFHRQPGDSHAWTGRIRQRGGGEGTTIQMGISAKALMARWSNGGAAMVPLGFPIRYTHSPVECVSLRDVEDMVRLLEALILDMDQGGWDAEKA